MHHGESTIANLNKVGQRRARVTTPSTTVKKVVVATRRASKATCPGATERVAAKPVPVNCMRTATVGTRVTVLIKVPAIGGGYRSQAK